MEEIRGAWLATGMGIFFGWAFLAWLVRAWAKLRTQAWTLDDYAVSGSVLAAFLHLVFILYAIRNGYGKPLDTFPDSTVTKIEIGLYLAQLFYVISFGLCRASAALFIAYISHSGPHIKPAQMVAAATAAWTIASTLAICIRGNIARPWTLLDGSPNMFIRWLAIEITGTLIEFVLWGTAVHLVWGIQMKLSKRIFIVCAFGARLLVVPFIIVRLIYLDPQRNSGPSRSATIADLVTEACVYFSIIASSVTAFRPMLTSFHTAHPVTELSASTSGLHSKDRTGARDPYYRLETIIPAAATVTTASSNNNNKKVVIGRAGVGDITWQPFQGSSCLPQASAYSKSGSSSRSATNSRTDRKSHQRRDSGTVTVTASLNRDRDAQVSSASDDSGRMIIQKTTEVTVQYK